MSEDHIHNTDTVVSHSLSSILRRCVQKYEIDRSKTKEITFTMDRTVTNDKLFWYHSSTLSRFHKCSSQHCLSEIMSNCRSYTCSQQSTSWLLNKLKHSGLGEKGSDDIFQAIVVLHVS